MQTPPSLFSADNNDRDFIGDERPVHVPTRTYSVVNLTTR